MFIFFDTETNGKPKTWNAKMHDVNNWPRVAQLAWSIYNREGQMISEHESLIFPDGWTIPKEQFFIDNGMSTERNIANGIAVDKVLNMFIADMQECEYLVAHNIQFDYNVLGAEMIRSQKKSEKKLIQICTMQMSTNFCQLPGSFGKFKWPKLEELHNILFGFNFDNAHDAMGDVKATAKCFFELVKRGVIRLP